MKKLILGVLALIVPMALVVYVSYVLGGSNVANFFGVIFIGLMCTRTFRYFNRVGKRDYTSNDDALWSALVFNAVIIAFHAFAGLVYGKIFIAGFDDNLLRFSPVMGALAYGSLLGSIICCIRLFKNQWLDAWEKVLTLSIMTFTFGFAFCCGYEALKPYGLVVPEQLGNLVSGLIAISVIGIISCCYKLTVYDVEHY